MITAFVIKRWLIYSLYTNADNRGTVNQSESQKCIIPLQYTDNKPWADIFAWLVFGRDYCREIRICFKVVWIQVCQIGSDYALENVQAL